MSLILKGIDIPTDGQIRLSIRPHGKVFIEERGISAEAIQIPKGHGRLIDFDRYLEHTTRITEASSFAEIIFPTTILEAEE